MRIRSQLTVALAALVTVASPGVARAADTVITFDDLPANTAPGDYYKTSQRVQFGTPRMFGLGAQFPVLPNRSCPSPGTLDKGISGKSLAIGCAVLGEASIWTYEAAISFLDERRGVSFKLRSPTGYTGPITVTLIRDNGSALESRVVNLPAGAIVPVSFTRATADVNVVVLTGRGIGSAADGFVELDDLTAPKDAVPPPPKFAIGLSEPSVDVPEAGTATTKVVVRRINGSIGPVTLSVAALSRSISAVRIDPNPVTGTDSPTLSITARGGFSGDRQITITATGTASAGTNVSAPVAQTARIVPALVPPEPLAERSAGVVAGCPSTYTQNVRLRGSFSGEIELRVAVQPGGPVVVTTPVVRVTADGEGTLAFPIGLSQPATEAGASNLDLTFGAEGLTTQQTTVRVNAGTGSVPILRKAGSFGPTVGFADQWLPEFTPGARDARGSDQIAVEGRLPAGCTYRFLDDLGQELPILSVERGRHVGQEGAEGGEVVALPDRAILQLPANARSTAVKDASGLFATTSRITLRSFRNSHALNGINSGPGAGTTDFTWSDFLRTFGSDDGDLCTPYGCVRDPAALIAWHFIAKKLESGKGLCFGWSTMALRFERGIDLPRLYEPLARYAANITNPEREGSAVKQQIVRWQASQQDMGWQDHLDDLEDDVPSLAAFHDALRAALTREDAVALKIRHPGGAHAVVAYDMRELGKGVFEILTYNPNFPYATAEESDAAVRDLNTRVNTIVVGPNAGEQGGGAWIAYVTDGVTPWVGGMDAIEIYDRLPPANADLPINPERWIAQLANWATASGPDTTQVAQIKAGGRDALRADGTAVPGSGVRDRITPGGRGSDVAYELSKGKSYDLLLRGAGSGRYSEGVMGGGVVATVETTRGAGEQDRVTVTPGEAQIAIAGGGSSAPATVDLATTTGAGATRAIEATLSAGAGRSDALAFTSDGAAVTLRHAGAPAAVALTIATAGAGAPQSITTAPLRIGTGQRLALRPVWGDLAAGAAYTVTDARGRVLRSGRAALRASATVRIGRGLSARLRRAERRVVVTGTIARPGSAPLLLVRAQAVRNGKVLATATVSRRGTGQVKAGRFSLPLTLRRLPRGAKVRVTVTLIDEGTTLATARATTTAR